MQIDLQKRRFYQQIGLHAENKISQQNIKNWLAKMDNAITGNSWRQLFILLQTYNIVSV